MKYIFGIILIAIGFTFWIYYEKPSETVLPVDHVENYNPGIVQEETTDVIEVIDNQIELLEDAKKAYKKGEKDVTLKKLKELNEASEGEEKIVNDTLRGVNVNGIPYKIIDGVSKWEYKKYYFEDNELKAFVGIIYEVIKWTNKLDGTRSIYFYNALYERHGARIHKGSYKYSKEGVSKIDLPILRAELREKAIEDFRVEVLNKIK